MDLTRQLDFMDQDRLDAIKVLAVGAGGINSFAVATLAQMGLQQIEVWDKDELEPHNIPNQNFDENMVGSLKVNALMKLIARRTGLMIDVHNDFWWGDLAFDPDIILTGVDSMGARIRIWEELKKGGDFIGKDRWLLDARMSGDALQLSVVHGQDVPSIEYYEKEWLFPSDEADQDPCTRKSIIYTVSFCAGLIARVVRAIINKDQVKQLYYMSSEGLSMSKSFEGINPYKQEDTDNPEEGEGATDVQE